MICPDALGLVFAARLGEFPAVVINLLVRPVDGLGEAIQEFHIPKVADWLVVSVTVLLRLVADFLG